MQREGKGDKEKEIMRESKKEIKREGKRKR